MGIVTRRKYNTVFIIIINLKGMKVYILLQCSVKWFMYMIHVHKFGVWIYLQNNKDNNNNNTLFLLNDNVST